MRALSYSIVIVAAVLLAAPGGTISGQDEPQRRQPRAEEPQKARPRSDSEPQQARPRAPSEAERGERRPAPVPEQRARQRPAPPPHTVPPDYYSFPRRYAFPPVSVRLGFYYHPYFGFYYGPYYGPFYPYPGPYPRSIVYGTSALRLRVKPVETEVYLNGYYAGIVDDFDGVFQRLYVPAGHHDLALRLDGYDTFNTKVYVAPGDTLDVTHQMRSLPAGSVSGPPPAPQPLPPEWAGSTPPPLGEEPASPYGVLALRVDPPDAQIVVDDEPWLMMEGRTELAMHVPAGWHRLEVRRDGYQAFRTELELTEGATTRLSVTLVK